MISENSRLYREHPDWCIHSPGRAPVESRNQLVLDMARSEVVDCIYNQISAMLSKYDISYVKWDMNRNIRTTALRPCLPKRRENIPTVIFSVFTVL